jgi:plasmid stability protein
MIVHGRSADRDAAVVQGITSEGGPARFAAAGLSVPDDVRSLVTEAGDASGEMPEALEMAFALGRTIGASEADRGAPWTSAS